MSKTAEDRINQTLSNTKTLVGDDQHTLLKTVVLQLDKQNCKDEVSGHMSLGSYMGSSTEKTQKRHLKRAILLAKYTLGGEAYTQKATILSGLSDLSKEQLVAKAKEVIKTQATPTGIVSKSLAADPSMPSNLKHQIGWGSSTDNLKQLCYVGTREWVVYTHLVIDGERVDLDEYGADPNWPSDRAAPWFPNPRHLAPDNPSTTGGHYNGMVGSGTDNHYLSVNTTLPSVNLQFGTPLVESELHADQVYQYNDSGDHSQWTNNDTWKAFSSGRWTLIRKIYKDGDSNKWMYEFTKKGAEESNRGTSVTTRSPILDFNKQNADAPYGYDEYSED